MLDHDNRLSFRTPPSGGSLRGAAFLAGLSVLACAAPGSDSRRPGPPEAITPELTLTIGEGAGDDERYSFSGIADVKAGSDGRIYVLDPGDHVVKVYDTGGTHLLSFGRRGSGPGEFRGPEALTVTDTSVGVREHVGRRDVLFSPSGAHLRTTIDTTRGADATYLMKYGHVLHFYHPHAGSGTDLSSIGALVLVHPRSSQRDTLARFESDNVMWQSEFIGIASVGTGDAGAWTLSGDSLFAVVDGYSGQATWYTVAPSGANVVRTESIGRTGAHPTAAEVAAIEERIREKAPGARPIGSMPRQRSVADRAMFDHQLGLWIRTPTPTDSTVVWTVFPRAAAPFVAQFPGGVTVRSVVGNLVVASAEQRPAHP